MIHAILVSVILLVVSVIMIISLIYNYKFGLVILNVQDTVAVSLDKLDERYASISRILQIPLYYDSPEIRQVHLDIEASRDAILQIAKAMNASLKDVDDDSQEE